MIRQKVVYEIPWLIERIYRESDKLLRSITEPSRFEERCIQDIGEYLLKNGNNIANKRYLIRMVKRKAEEARRMFKQEESDYYQGIIAVNDDGDEIEYEPIDELGSVESEAMVNEMTALLGKDGRCKAILKAWTIGNTNDRQVSGALGRAFGGNPESHRKFIQRFRNESREQLLEFI